VLIAAFVGVTIWILGILLALGLCAAAGRADREAYERRPRGSSASVEGTQIVHFPSDAA
jgi:hypothetical protein